jgi:uncharacterized protein (TIGR03083 family)
MRLEPRYDTNPILSIDGPIDAQREPVIRQRRRLGELLQTLSDEQWRHPSRCEGWSVQDVVNHLIGTNSFWAASIGAGLEGNPTKILASFDPQATPALMVDGMRALAPAETLQQFLTTDEQLLDAFEGLDADGWAAIAESPPGHVPIALLAQHALWDGLIHERDIALPLRMTPVEEPDEIAVCLRYVAALGPAFAASTSGKKGALVIDATEPDLHVVVEVGDAVTVHGGSTPESAVRLEGRAIDLLEALSIRQPLDVDIPDEDAWLLTGLAVVFDAA